MLLGDAGVYPDGVSLAMGAPETFVARFSLPLLLLACTAGKDSGTECASDDPCACGVAWTERRGPVPTIQDAVNGARSGETVFVCEGEIVGRVQIAPSVLDSVEAAPELTLVGAGREATVLLPDEEPKFGVLTIGGVATRVQNLTLSGGEGEPYVYDNDNEYHMTNGGAVSSCSARVSFEDVAITGNAANLGGGISTWCGGNIGLTEFTLTDSAVTANAWRTNNEGYYGGGGAWLTDAFVLTSINTDWGSGDTDNRDDDIAIGPFGGPYTTYTDFGAAENFVCSSETQACMRTE